MTYVTRDIKRQILASKNRNLNDFELKYDTI